MELLHQIRVFNPNGRKQFQFFGSPFRFQFPRQSLLSDRDFPHLAGRQECLEFAVWKLFDLLHGHDEIVHENDRENREEDIQNREGRFIIHWHRDTFLSLSPTSRDVETVRQSRSQDACSRKNDNSHCTGPVQESVQTIQSHVLIGSCKEKTLNQISMLGNSYRNI